MRSSFKESYDQSKGKHGIIEMLNGEMPVPPPQTPKKKAAKPKPAPSDESATLPEGVSVPKSMAARYVEVAEIIEAFCDEKLNSEFKDICLRALAKLCRKRPSPLATGKARTWACGIVYAIGSNNFIFDKSQSIYMPATEIAEWFGLAKSTAGNKSAEITKLLNLSYMDAEFSMRHLTENNPMIWYLSVNGYMVDIRKMPKEAQKAAFNKGLIPYIPADRDD
jgi:hypothetical protein